jgi:flagellar hook-length control protein FliK
MLNITLPTQVKTLADQPTTNDASSNHARANAPANEEFSNVLAREVSEKKADSEKKVDSDKKVDSEKTAIPEKTADSEKAPAPEKTAHSEETIAPETDSNPISSESLSDASSPSLTANSQLANTPGSLLAETQNNEIPQVAPSIIEELSPGIEVTPPIAFAPISVLTQNKQPTQEMSQILGSTHPATKKPLHAMGQTLDATHPSSNFLLQQNQIQNPQLNTNILQKLGTADFAASGKNLSFYAETNKAIFAQTGESALSSLTDSMSTQQPGLNSFSSILSTTAATAAAPQDLSLSAQVGQPKWGNDFAQKIVWLSNQQNQVAEIRLNPAHLGPVEVMLNMTSDQATAQFASPHAAVREAIEAALPRLREMMAESGIALGNVTVGADSFQQQEQTNQHAQSSSGNGQNLMGNNGESIDPTETRMPPNRHQGLVNTFA